MSRTFEPDDPGAGNASVRPAAVAGTFYPAAPDVLADLVDALIAATSASPDGARPGLARASGGAAAEGAEAGGAAVGAAGRAAGAAGAPGRARPAEETSPTGSAASAGALVGLLVPHAGLVYSGAVAGTAWRLAANAHPTSIILLGTNHVAAWLSGVAAWETGAWQTPLGDISVDTALAAEVCGLGPPFVVDREAHHGEHSIEVQLPFVARLLPGVPVVPLAVGTGTGGPARAAGARLGALLARRRATGERPLLVISSDMAHYPAADVAERVTETLLPSILDLDGEALAAAERIVRQGAGHGVVCGMCGIEPSVLGLAALRAAGATKAARLAAATSADAGGDSRRTVGYLSVAFTRG